MTEPVEPKPVDDGCGLLPHVPRDLVAWVVVSRMCFNEATQTEHPFVLPRRFTPSDDEIAVAEFAGGGHYRAQAKSALGRFLKGYATRLFTIDGPEVPLGVPTAANDAQPPPPPAASASPPPVALASLGVPVSQPLPGMPSVSLDIPGLDPNMRAWMQAAAAQQAFVWHAVTGSAQVAIQAAFRGAEAEREAAQRTVGVAERYLQTVTGPRMAADGAALVALTGELGTVRAELVTVRAELTAARSDFHVAALDAARLRTMLETGGQMPARNSPGWAGFLERMTSIVLGRLGPPGAALVAAHFGLNAEEFRALTAAAEPLHPAGNGSPAAG